MGKRLSIHVDWKKPESHYKRLGVLAKLLKIKEEAEFFKLRVQVDPLDKEVLEERARAIAQEYTWHPLAQRVLRSGLKLPGDRISMEEFAAREGWLKELLRLISLYSLAEEYGHVPVALHVEGEEERLRVFYERILDTLSELSRYLKEVRVHETSSHERSRT